MDSLERAAAGLQNVIRATVIAARSQPPTGGRLTVIVESPQNSTRWLSEESIVDVARALTVSFRGLSDGHQMSHPDGPRVTAMTERDLAKNDQWSQRAFGHIVGGRHARIVQKHEPLVLILQNSLLQCERFFMSHRIRHHLFQAFSQPDCLRGLLSIREFTIAAKSMKATAVSSKPTDGFADADRNSTS